jgi:hypothetical protein
MSVGNVVTLAVLSGFLASGWADTKMVFHSPSRRIAPHLRREVR